MRTFVYQLEAESISGEFFNQHLDSGTQRINKLFKDSKSAKQFAEFDAGITLDWSEPVNDAIITQNPMSVHYSIQKREVFG